MDGRRNRGSARHAGIVLLPRRLPSGATSWRARYADHEGRTKYETLPSHLTTEEQRSTWAITRKKELDREGDLLEREAKHEKEERREQELRGTARESLPLKDAVRRYYADVSAGLRPRTIRDYEEATDGFLAWTAAQGLKETGELRPRHLAELRTSIVNQPRRRTRKGGKRGENVEAAGVRSAHTVNRNLRGIATMLLHLEDHDLLPESVSPEKIAKELRLVSPGRPVVDCLSPAELVRLVEAARRHDAATYAMTRKEKAAGAKGGTPRYEPVLPYVATVLLGGFRADEARLLRWEDVDLAAAPAGQVVLRPEGVKTKIGRIVDLFVSPAIRSILTTLKLRAGSAPYVFGGEEPLSETLLLSARRRLIRAFGAPRFSWQQLRATCGSYLANAPGIFGGASAFREAKQLGHSVAVAEKHYLRVVHVPTEAKTLEAAMGIEDALRRALELPAAVVSRQKRA